jgi:lysophospholipase L1-like esterase
MTDFKTPAQSRTALELGDSATQNAADLPVSTATQTALDTEESSRISGDAGLQGAIDANEIATANAQELALSADDRPGDNPDAFSATLTGSGTNKTTLPSTGVVVVTGLGSSYAITGANIIGKREPIALCQDVWEFTARVQRTSDPADPANHATRFRVQWLDKDKAALSITTLFEDLALLVSDGVVEWSYRVSHLDVAGVVAPPATAVYAVPYIQTYGDDGVTAIDALRAREITDIHVAEIGDLSAVIAAANAATLAANNAAALVATETLAAMADVTGYTRAAGVGVISLKGGYAAFDGFGGQWAYDAADTTTASNPPFVLVGADGARYKPARTSNLPGLSFSDAVAVQSGIVAQCGDSNTDNVAGRPGWQSAADVEWFGNGAPLHNWTDYNLGNNGSTLAGWVGGIASGSSGTAITTRGNPWAVVNTNPNLISVKLGTNDMGLNSARATSGSEATFRDNFEKLINFYLLKTNASILLVLPQPFVPESFSNTVSWANANEAATLSARMRTLYLEWVGRDPRVTVYDSHKDLFGLRIDDKAADALDPVTNAPLMSDSLHPTDLGFRRVAQRLARKMNPNIRRLADYPVFPTANETAASFAVPVYVNNVEVSGTLLTLYSDPVMALGGRLAGKVTGANPVSLGNAVKYMEAMWGAGNSGVYQQLRSLYNSAVKIFFPASGNSYDCTTFRLSQTVPAGGSNDAYDKYSITGTTIAETGPAMLYVENWYEHPFSSPDLLTVSVDRDTDIIVPFRGKRGMRAELFSVDAARIGFGGIAASFDLHFINVNNGATAGTLAFSTAFSAGLALSNLGSLNAGNFPNGVLMDARGNTPFGFRLTNFVNFGTSGREGVVTLGIRYYV